MSRRNAPEIFFSAVRGCPRLCARTNPWFRSQTLLVPGHGGGGVLSFAKFVAKGTHRNAPRVTFTCVEVAWVNILAILMFPSSP